MLADIIEDHFAIERRCLQETHQRVEVEDALFLREAVAAVSLQRRVDRRDPGVCRDELRHVGELAGFTVLIEHPGGLERHQRCHLNPGARICERVLHALIGSDRHILEDFALVRVGERAPAHSGRGRSRSTPPGCAPD